MLKMIRSLEKYEMHSVIEECVCPVCGRMVSPNTTQTEIELHTTTAFCDLCGFVLSIDRTSDGYLSGHIYKDDSSPSRTEDKYDSAVREAEGMIEDCRRHPHISPRSTDVIRVLRNLLSVLAETSRELSRCLSERKPNNE